MSQGEEFRRMAEAGLHLIPPHMHEAVLMWVEFAEPPPAQLGGFFKAVLCNQLVEAFGRADTENTLAMRGWADFVYNHLPSPAWGSRQQLDEWYEAFHPKQDAVEP